MGDIDAKRPGAVAFFDVDGTLVWRDSKKLPDGSPADVEKFNGLRPTPGVYEAFRQMRQNGNAAFICTGRPFFMIREPIRSLGPVGYVAEAGAYVRVGDTVVRDECIDRDLLLETLHFFDEAKVNIEVESNEGNVAFYPAGGVSTLPGCITVNTLAEFLPYVERYRFAKFCARGFAPEQLKRVKSFCEQYYTMCNMQFDTYEFSLKGVDKGSGIKAALDFLGYDGDRTFAFGDSENDLSMAGAVGTFVAMGNALPNVKAAADYVTNACVDDGVVTGLAHFGLI